MQTQSFKIKSKPFEGESKVWLVALDIITKKGDKDKVQRYSLSIDEAIELESPLTLPKIRIQRINNNSQKRTETA